MAETASLKPRPESALWTAAHLRELDAAFPERTNPAPAEELQYRTGQRQVVAWVRERTRHSGG